MAAASWARRSGVILLFLFAVPAGVFSFLSLRFLARTACLLFLEDRFFFFAGAFNLNLNLANFFVSFSILVTRRRIFLLRFLRFITTASNVSGSRYGRAGEPYISPQKTRLSRPLLVGHKLTARRNLVPLSALQPRDKRQVARRDATKLWRSFALHQQGFHLNRPTSVGSRAAGGLRFASEGHVVIQIKQIGPTLDILTRLRKLSQVMGFRLGPKFRQPEPK